MSSLLDRIFDKTVHGLSKTMDLTWRRNQAIASNIANAETPQYRAVDLNFAGELERAFERRDASLRTTNEKHFAANQGDASAHYVVDYSGATKPDGNNVDLDLQMGKLAYNSGQYSIAANLMRKHLQILRSAIREGR